MEGDAAELAKRLHNELQGCRLESEASCPWTSFVITIPAKHKKATLNKLVQLATRAPKARTCFKSHKTVSETKTLTSKHCFTALQATKIAARAASFFEDDDAGEASRTASATMKESLSVVVRLEYKGEPVCTPVFVVGKTKDGNALVGAFAIRVWT